MSSFHFELKSGKPGTAAKHVAYVTRKGFHARRGDLVATGYGNMPTWSKNNPELYWSSADQHERVNGAAYREAVVALPNELSISQNVVLAKELAEKLAGARPYHYGIHAPISSLEGETNLHVHVVMSDRRPDGIERSPEMTFKRFNAANPERGGCRKSSGGLTRMQLRDQVIATRKLVADTLNSHLERHGHETRVDHRTLREQGVNRLPERHLGPARIRGMSTKEKAQYVASRPGRRGFDEQRALA